MTTLRGALADLLENHDLPVEEAADRHISPDFRQRTNGQWDDRAGFLARIRRLRSNTQEVTITVLDEITDGSSYAERHLIELLAVDGRRVGYEVYVFAALGSDGRFERIEEATVRVGPAT
ncbi:hypothetical protein [uncultured Arthrobacter sp.]|uniref:hypothetical protein n=1 Tax=uncultured Arthrobacter sp. TaxID=114050 RepID=UPI0028D8B52D|nr:hypothetical protein [uncultured Arthrobacter sp.]